MSIDSRKDFQIETYNSQLAGNTNTASLQGGRSGICLSRGQDNTVFDASGRAFIDFTSGGGENILGYSHPTLLSAIASQCNTLLHIGREFYNEISDELASELIEGTVFNKVYFGSSGAETLATAINLITSFLSSKQGDTTKQGEGSLPKKKILIVASSLASICFGATYQNCYLGQHDLLKFTPQNDFDAFKTNLTPDVGAVIFEMYQVENGLTLTKHDFLLQAYAHCKSKGALIVMNECGCGMGRTGYLFSYQYSGINSDVVLLSKGLGGGMPISALLTRGEFSYFIPKNQDTHALRFLPSLATARVVLRELKCGMFERVVDIGNYLKAKLFKLSKFDFLKEIRGLGLLLGVELDARVSVVEVVARLAKEGILLTANREKNTLLLIPPYTITRAEIDTTIDAMTKVFSKIPIV